MCQVEHYLEHFFFISKPPNFLDFATLQYTRSLPTILNFICLNMNIVHFFQQTERRLLKKLAPSAGHGVVILFDPEFKAQIITNCSKVKILNFFVA